MYYYGSVDKISIRSTNELPMEMGFQIEITAIIYLPSSLKNYRIADFFYAADASNPSWEFLQSVVPTKVDSNNTLTILHTLKGGSEEQAVRVILRDNLNNPAISCSGEMNSDVDDLIFAVAMEPLPRPTVDPTSVPTQFPSNIESGPPSIQPTFRPTPQPTRRPERVLPPSGPTYQYYPPSSPRSPNYRYNWPPTVTPTSLVTSNPSISPRTATTPRPTHKPTKSPERQFPPSGPTYYYRPPSSPTPPDYRYTWPPTVTPTSLFISNPTMRPERQLPPSGVRPLPPSSPTYVYTPRAPPTSPTDISLDKQYTWPPTYIPTDSNFRPTRSPERRLPPSGPTYVYTPRAPPTSPTDIKPDKRYTWPPTYMPTFYSPDDVLQPTSKYASGLLFDSNFKAPRCSKIGTLCDSDSFLVGAAASERNKPNAVDGCNGEVRTQSSGHSESIDRIVIRSQDGIISDGEEVEVEITITRPKTTSARSASNHLSIARVYYAPDITIRAGKVVSTSSNEVRWEYVSTDFVYPEGEQKFHARFNLRTAGRSSNGEPALQAIRVTLGKTSFKAGPCASNLYFDVDDLLFQVPSENRVVGDNGGVESVSSTIPTAFPTIDESPLIPSSVSSVVVQQGIVLFPCLIMFMVLT